nr:TolC family protein [uncultured Cellulosilyticum sp.]
MSKKLIASLMVATLLVSNTSYAQSQTTTSNIKAQTTQSTKVAEADAQQDTYKKIEEIKGAPLTLDEAISQGLTNSLVLKQVQNQADIAKLVGSNGESVRNSLNENSMALSHAGYLIEDGRDKVYAGQIAYDTAQAYLKNNLSPIEKTIPVTIEQLNISTSVTIKPGDDISVVIASELEKFGVPESVASSVGEKYETQILAAAKEQLSATGDTLLESQKKLESSTQEYLSSKSQYDAAVQFAMANVANKLSTSTITSLRTEPLGELIIKMVTTQDKVTAYSVNIYKNQVALLIENSYFEALKQQKLLEVKDKAMERGLVQYELAKAAYEVGGKSKDDMLLAKSYYDSTVMARELQVKDYNAALINLKKNMNIDLSKEIQLVEVAASPEEEYDLEKGIQSGLTYQLNIKMAEAQVELYDELMEAVDASNYSSSDNQHKEVVLLQQKAKIALDQAKLQAESDIRTSYSTVQSMQKIVKTAAELRQSATENVEIAKVKYEVGYGYDNALLKQLNLQDMSGTIVEVIAAEENLTNIEEKEIEAINGYNLARLKYQNDIGILPYK